MPDRSAHRATALGGNFRLMTRVKYNLQRIHVKALLNHGEYDR
jgi:mRNA-degrading endonuclease HigB of HigAB toxin-antitoxin module